MTNIAPKPFDPRPRLPKGTVLRDSYLVDGEIGAGGFGITYRAHHKILGRPVAIKEYFPLQVSNRDNTMSIHPVSEAQGQVFAWGRTGFLNEARMLTEFKHSNIVSVFEFFEANNTAYMVLQFEEGPSLGRWLERLGRMPSQPELDKIVSSLCDALTAIHNKTLIHRDIAPDNIIIRPDGTPVLLDFGAARYEVAEATKMRDKSVHTTSYAVIKAYYSPIEQRSTDTRKRGPWSDIYALGATLYRCVTGEPPMDANDRQLSRNDPLVPAVTAAKPGYRRSFLEAIDGAMTVFAEDRPQSIEQFRAIAFASAPTQNFSKPAVRSQRPMSEPRVALTLGQTEDQRNLAPAPSAPSGPLRVAAIAAGVSLLVLMGGWMMLQASPRNPGAGTRQVASSVAADELRVEREKAAAAERRAAEAEEARRRAEEARRLAEDAARRSASDSSRRAEEAARRAEEAARRAEDEAKRRGDEAVKRAEAAARRVEEESRKRAETPPPAPAPRVLSWARLQNKFVEGDGYRWEGDSTVARCEQLCAGDDACSMFEFHPPKKKCNLFKSVRPYGSTNDGTTVGIKR